MEAHAADEFSPVLPGAAPGWAASWWLYEQGATPPTTSTVMPPERRFELLNGYFEAEGDGWRVPEAVADHFLPVPTLVNLVE